MVDFWHDLEEALAAWGDGLRTGNAALIASVYEDQAMSLQPGRPMHVGIDAVRGFWQEEMDRGVRDSETKRLFADERDGLGVEVSHLRRGWHRRSGGGGLHRNGFVRETRPTAPRLLAMPHLPW